MTKAQFLITALLLILFPMACAQKAAPMPQAPAPAPAAASMPAPAAGPVKPAWEAGWEKTLAAAKKEGSVVIATSISPSVRNAMASGVKEAYGISLESVAGRGPEMNPRVLAERRAGLYNYDIYLSGSSPALNDLKPASALDPLQPAFILPDLTDPELIKKVWWEGKLWWADADHTHLVPMVTLQFAAGINTNMVKEGEIKTYRDLLNPKWQGKLVFNDPTIAGTSANFISFAVAVLGWDFVEDLAKAKPIIMRDERLMIDWLARGKVALVVPPKPDVFTEFVQAGAPLKGIIPAEGTFLVGGSSNLSIYNRPPHPNAAKIFVNWYLSKEGQAATAVPRGLQSLRVDVSTAHLPPEQVMQPGMKYFNKDDEKVIFAQPELIKKAKELLGPLMK